jgi:hypothetical protein
MDFDRAEKQPRVEQIGKVGPRDKDGAFWRWAGLIGWAFEMVVGNLDGCGEVAL